MTRDKERILDGLLGIDHEPPTAAKRREAQRWKWRRDRLLAGDRTRQRKPQKGAEAALDAALGIDVKE